jgi:hypothetical protein
MLLIGFGFLMVFVRKNGYSSVTTTFLRVAISLPVYMLVRPYLWGSASALTVTNISMLLFAEFAAFSQNRRSHGVFAQKLKAKTANTLVTLGKEHV